MFKDIVLPIPGTSGDSHALSMALDGASAPDAPTRAAPRTMETEFERVDGTRDVYNIGDPDRAGVGRGGDVRANVRPA